MGNLMSVPLTDIRPNKVALRSVNRQSEDFLGLVASIKEVGFDDIITVRKAVDEETNQEYYEICDGLHRFTACQQAGIEEMDVKILDISDDDVLFRQVLKNVHKIETRPVEYTTQLKRILTNNRLLTESELAAKLGKSTAWIQQRLNLTKIENEKIQELINEGKIPLSNAYALTKLEPEEQLNFLDAAQVKTTAEFISDVEARAKEIRDSKRKGRNAKPAEFTPIATCQKVSDIKAEMENPVIGPALCKDKKEAVGFAKAVKWVLHLDDESIALQRAKYEERQKLRDEARAKSKAKKKEAEAQRKEERAKEAARIAEEARAALENEEV